MITALRNKLFTTSRIAACVAVLALGLASAPASAAQHRSAVYCIRGPENTLSVFAARLQRDGRLRFGISLWNERQHNIGVYGLASRQDGRWVYSDSLGADDQCKLTIALTPGGAARVTADHKANCDKRGGVGTSIGSVQFPSSAYQGPVTFELDDSEAFFSKAGRC
ncbi:MAG TPA: hypothetical protein VGL73_09980 [Caulobacteraceae bacterium]|jgi:hypothetical protein